jgi:hypothetical protein
MMDKNTSLQQFVARSIRGRILPADVFGGKMPTDQN